MYKLLLATSVPEIVEGFNSVPSYEVLGFRKPVIATTAEEAIRLLAERHFDGIAYDFKDDSNLLIRECLVNRFPLMPIINADANKYDIGTSLKELGKLLGRLNADDSDDPVSTADMMQICRHNYLRNLLDGKVMGFENVHRSLRMLRSRMDPTRPCVVVSLALPENNDFFTGRWHYGPERLETALRNFFGVEINNMRILAVVLPDEQIRVLCCPMVNREVATESMTGMVMDHLQETIGMVSEYLGIELNISGVDVLPSISALAK